MLNTCKAFGCFLVVKDGHMFCESHYKAYSPPANTLQGAIQSVAESLSAKYPKYYKNIRGMTEIDVYGVHQLFEIDDPSGAIQHASKKLLLSGVRTGGKSKHDDIKEARDTLTRWLDLNP